MHINVKLLSIPSYGCENELPTLKQEQKVSKFEHRVRRGILEPKSDEVAKDLENAHNVNVRNFCSLSSTVRRIRPGRPPYVFMVREREVPKPHHKTYSNTTTNKRD
jgi:nucleoid DNA-binding protein